MGSTLRIATSQFPVSGSIARNLDYMTRHMKQAADEDAAYKAYIKYGSMLMDLVAGL